jgi:SAM-dependent methyltransferase
MRTIFHLSRLRGTDFIRIAMLIDDQTGVRADAVVRLLSPWRSWLEITNALATSTSPTELWFNDVAENEVVAVAIISDRLEFVNSAEHEAHARGLRIVNGAYEASTPRDTALLQEMAHHHFELGGVNEFDGAPVQYAIPVLQSLSAANCARYFPMYMLDKLRGDSARLGRRIEALDVGSGPISHLRWGAIEGFLHVTGVDPLHDVYDIVLAYHGLDPLPSIQVDRAITANAENLDQHVPAASFGFAYCCNALDHVENPPEVVAQIARALRPGGRFALQFATREGSRQNWQQLHQFDLFLNPSSDKLMCQGRDGRTEALVPEATELELDAVVVSHPDYTVVTLKRE